MWKRSKRGSGGFPGRRLGLKGQKLFAFWIMRGTRSRHGVGAKTTPNRSFVVRDRQAGVDYEHRADISPLAASERRQLQLPGRRLLARAIHQTRKRQYPIERPRIPQEKALAGVPIALLSIRQAGAKPREHGRGLSLVISRDFLDRALRGSLLSQTNVLPSV